MGTTPGSWAAVATWRRYFDGAAASEHEQWQADRFRQIVDDCDIDKVGQVPKYYYYRTSREYARSAFTDFVRETRRSVPAVGRSSNNNSIRFNNNNSTDTDTTVAMDRTSASTTTTANLVADPRHMFLPQ